MTSTTMAETCCETHLPGLWRDIMRQAEDPWRTDPVQLVLDTPVAADVQRDALRPGLAGDQAGDAERGYRRTRAAVEVTDVPFDQECLAGVRADPGRGGQDLDGAGLLAPVPPAAP